MNVDTIVIITSQTTLLYTSASLAHHSTVRNNTKIILPTATKLCITWRAYRQHIASQQSTVNNKSQLGLHTCIYITGISAAAAALAPLAYHTHHLLDCHCHYSASRGAIKHWAGWTMAHPKFWQGGHNAFGPTNNWPVFLAV